MLLSYVTVAKILITVHITWSLAGTRWLGIRLDLLSTLLIGAVALFAAFYSTNNGKHIIYIVLFFLVLPAHLKPRVE